MSKSPLSPVLAIARGYVAAGLSVIPVKLDGTKQPAADVLPRIPDPEQPDRYRPSWKPLQERVASDDELKCWFGGRQPYGVAVACGAVSAGAECLDFDDKETAREFCEIVKAEEPALYSTLSLESTPNGVHVWYLTTAGDGNRALAGRPDGFDGKGRPKTKKTIETRGQGGYAIVAGSPLAVHNKGLPYEHVGGPPLTALVRISDEDRDYLFRVAMSFDREDRRTAQAKEKVYRPDELSPGDDYDLRGELFSQLLQDAVFSSNSADEGSVRRPGKERGNSATVGRCRGPRGEPLLKVFTSNWHPFEAGKCYGRFQVLRLTRFDGDGAAATKYLAGRGFGSPARPPGNGVKQVAVIPDPAAGEEPAVEPPLPLVHYADITVNLDAADFVQGILIDGAMSVVYGESGCGKTFFELDMTLHVAAGIPWRGRRVEQRGALYLALEGWRGIFNRVAAFKIGHRMNAVELPFAVVPVAIDLLDPAADTARVIAAAKAAAARMTIPVGLIVVDTLSRAMAGGNENTSEDMGALIKNIDRIRQALPAHVGIVHHSGKDGAKGARGHSSLRAATDTEIEVTRDLVSKTSVARVTKQRELELGDEFAFRLERVELGTNRHGETVASCVVREADAAAAPDRQTAAIQKMQERERLKAAFEQKRDDDLDAAVLDAVRAETADGTLPASMKAIQRRTKTKPRAVESVERLVDAGRLVKTGPFKKPSGQGAMSDVPEGYRLSESVDPLSD